MFIDFRVHDDQRFRRKFYSIQSFSRNLGPKCANSSFDQLIWTYRYVNNRTADYWYHTYGLLELEDSGPGTAFLADIQVSRSLSYQSMGFGSGS